MFGVWYECVIHNFNTGAVIRGDRQGLFYGKSEASRCGTHLLKAGSSFSRIAAQADFFEYPSFKELKTDGFSPPVLFLLHIIAYSAAGASAAAEAIFIL